MSARVLHLINGEYFGGSARVLTNYLASDARRAEVAVGLLFPGELQQRLEQMRVPTMLIDMRSRADLTAVRDVRRMAGRFRADLVHTHQLRTALLARLASTVGGPPVVSHVHSPAFRESTSAARNLVTGAVDRLLAGRTSRFICVSHSLGAELRRLGVAPDRIRVVPNGIPMPPPVDRAMRAAVRAELEIPDDAPLIGMVANFRPRKGAELLIEAVAALPDSVGDAWLLLVGEAFRDSERDYGAELAAAATTAGIGARTILTGFRGDVERLIGALDLLVLPSRFGEGLPMVLLEAMGAGVPVISTPVEGIAEVVSDGQNGILVPPNDAPALSAAIARLLADPDLRGRLAGEGRATVLAGYSADAMATGIEAVYAELIGAG